MDWVSETRKTLSRILAAIPDLDLQHWFRDRDLTTLCSVFRLRICCLTRKKRRRRMRWAMI
jgi:hypothetical protein